MKSQRTSFLEKEFVCVYLCEKERVDDRERMNENYTNVFVDEIFTDHH